MFRFDGRNTGCNRGADGPGSAPAPKWSFETGEDVWGSPVVADGTLYVGSYDEHMYALSAETGEEIWRYRTGDRIDGTPAVVDGTVYFGSFDRNVYALDAETGEELWTRSTGGIVRSSPTVAGGTVFVGTHCRSSECAIFYDEDFPKEGYVYALDADSGDVIWRYETGDEVLSTPAVDSSVVYVGSSDRNVHAVDRSTGERSWAYETGGPIYGSPVLSGGRVYVGSNSDNVYALDADTGDLAWEFDPQASVLTGSPAVCDDSLYIGGGVSTDDRIYTIFYAISTDDGRERWSEQLPGEIIGGSPAVADGVVYIGSHNITESDVPDPGIFALSGSGDVSWSFTVHDSDHFHGDTGFGSSPAVVGDTLYIGSADSHVYAFS
jgi:outer membrane protein assembly factor BamB